MMREQVPGSTVRVGLYRNASDVQQPSPLRIKRMLHAGCMELVSWHEWPTRCVPLDIEERVDGLPRLQVVSVAVLQEDELSGGLLQRRSFIE